MTARAKMSKILYVASTYSHIKSFHLDYINALRDEGHEVFIMANGEGADYNVPFAKRLFSYKNFLARKQIRKIISEGGFDKILVNTTLSAFHLRLALSSKNRPHVVNFVHGYLFSKNTPWLKRTLLLFCERFLRSRTDTVIVMNSEDAQIATENSLAKEVYFSHGMGVKQKPVIKSREKIREELNLSDTDYVITYVAELSKRKNQSALVRCMPKLLMQIPNARLILVGNGDSKEKLEKQIKKLSRNAKALVFICYFLHISSRSHAGT